MTQEEKAKHYDEAIKRARQIHDADRVSGIELTTCEEIFPELVESEDERIRKALIDWFSDKHAADDFRGIAWERIVAWLEKQGEHANFRNKIQIGDKVTRNQDGVLVNLSQLNRVAKKDEKQGEQKPAVKMKTPEESLGIDSDTYNKIVDECIYEYEKDRADAIAEIQKPWSEEDEKILNEVILDLKVLKHRDSGEEGKAAYQKEIDWLESLKSKNKWKHSD